jgi:tRNA isopentenyl-2-thiomethyl-A-37 hydroxylase MiaE
MRKTETERALALLESYQNELANVVDKLPDHLICEALDAMHYLGEAMEVLRKRVQATEILRQMRLIAKKENFGPRNPLW